MKKIAIDQLLFGDSTIVDVRSPSEFEHAHVPQALNLPLFSDEERRLVGIEYKQVGSKSAIEKGLQLVQFPRIIQQIHSLNLPHSIYIYCARGGMRSSSMAWLLELLGYEVNLIQGGYKSFRRWVLDQFSKSYSLILLGGETGSGKTKIIQELPIAIDLEGLARHRGSVFGYVSSQPTQEQFENELAIELFEKKDQTIWLEDESQRIGNVMIPNPLFDQMKKTNLVVLQTPEEIRIQNCMKEYLQLGDEKLKTAIQYLNKRLGSDATKKALDAIEKKEYRTCCEILLRYYDKKYRYGMAQRDQKNLRFLPWNQKLDVYPGRLETLIWTDAKAPGV